MCVKINVLSKNVEYNCAASNVEITYCYYSTDLYQFKNNKEGLTGISTEALCKALPEGFDCSIWGTGSALKSVNGKFND